MKGGDILVQKVVDQAIRSTVKIELGYGSSFGSGNLTGW
jgi:hypothetical protein